LKQNNSAQSFIGLGIVVLFEYRLHLALGEERIEQRKYVLLFAIAELFNILKPFDGPTVKGHVAGLPSEIVQCDTKSLGNLLCSIERRYGLPTFLLADHLAGYAAVGGQL